MESVAAQYDEDARAAGIYIVSACGFDSIPHDLGVLLLQRTFNGELAYVESFVTIDGEVRGVAQSSWGSFGCVVCGMWL